MGPPTVRFVYALTFWLFFGVTSIVLYCGALVLFVITLPFDPNGRVQHFYSCFWGALYIYANPFWKLRIDGRGRLPLKGPAVIVSNHQSSADIFVLFSLYRPFKWVSKESMFKTPCIGWNMSLNRYVKLKRGDKDSIGRMMAACERWLSRGVPVLMFPEGTRSRDGEVHAFKDGAFRLAISAGVPVIPIVLDGTGRTMPAGLFSLSPRGMWNVRVLDPVPPGQDVTALREQVHGLIATELKSMRTA
jgi:1-acyl-sn-glycerol-3-phosphate acyltransferase